jgi:hypothetical protein
MLQKQLARSKVAMQGEGDGEDEEEEGEDAPQCAYKVMPTSIKVGRRNLGGGTGQLAFRARMLTMRAAFVGLFCFTNTSAFGRLGCRATSPAWSKASSMACTRGQLEGL